MGLTIEELRENYESFDDRKLMRLITEEAKEIRPEALELLKKIIEERGLSDDISKSVEVQFKEVTKEELVGYCEIFRHLPCPICNSNTEKLNATMTGTVVSFIVITNYDKKLIIACPDCLDKQNNKASVKSLLLGWWGLPWGIIRTMQALILNNDMKDENRKIEPNYLLKSFVLERIGKIEAFKNNPTELKLMIKDIQ